MLEKEVKVTWQENTENLLVKTCAECGFPIEPFISPVTGRILCPVCPCEIEKETLERKRLFDQQKKAKLDYLFAGCAIGEALPAADLEGFVERPGTEDAYAAVMEYVKNLPDMIEKGQGLIIVGPPGCGKSHLVSAVANKVREAGYSVLFERAPKLLMRLRSAYNSKSRVCELELFEALGRVDLLVIDDLGAEKRTDWSEQTIYTVIDERYASGRATLITTNLSLEELEEKVGERTMDRLIGSCRIIENRASSYRQERAGQLKG